jgi:hypothetical protein
MRFGAGTLPMIGGHEASGVVSAIGPGVTEVAVGDHVVLSFDSCGARRPAKRSVFGDPAVTGKPILDDLRDGKGTVLIALTRQGATPAQRAQIELLHGTRTSTTREPPRCGTSS